MRSEDFQYFCPRCKRWTWRAGWCHLCFAFFGRRLLLLLVVAVIGASSCAPPSLLLRREYGPLGIEVEIWRLRDGTCERRAFVGPYFYRSIVPCPEK